MAGLGMARMRLGLLEEALDALRAGVRLHPDDPYLLSSLAHAELTAGRTGESIALLRRAMAVQPAPELHSLLLYALNHEALDPAGIARDHTRWGQLHACRPLKPVRFSNATDPRRRLRIGYVSGDFRRSAPACFFEPLLDGHDRARFEITCYDNGEADDATFLRLKASACRWRRIAGLTDRKARATIRRDGIDILVDLSGHTGGNRLGIFAGRAAPVQVTYLGYPNSTGLEQMDYRLTDAIADPPGMTARFHTERLLRLPRCFVAFRPHDSSVPVARAPSLDHPGAFVFGSFSRPCKWSGPTVAAWAEILRRAPASRLLLHHHVLRRCSEGTSRFVEDGIRRRFAALGVDPGRVDFTAGLEAREHFELYGRVDLALDPFPYNGTTSLCEGLWMGVPAVALEGDAHVSRVASSLLRAAGLGSFVCRTTEAYVRKAVESSSSPRHSSRLRSGMRSRLAASPLMDGAGLAAAIEREYRRVWRAYCRSVQP